MRHPFGMLRIALLGLLLLGSMAGIGLGARPGATAQEIQATPLTDEAATGDSFAPASELTLTLDTGQISFGRLIAGGAMHLEDAVVVTISGSSGTPWQLSCSASPTAAHTTSAPVDTLAYAPADSTNWMSFQPSPAPCFPVTSDDAVIGFDYLVLIPANATGGDYEVVVTYSVTSLE